jgi:hypothetical protein
MLPFIVCSVVSMLFLARATNQRQQANAAIVAGTVLDADSMTPLAGVEISWKSRKVTSDSAGRYEIQLPAGVRELSFAARDRRLVRKVIIVREPGARVRQDVLLPASPETPRKVLALDRGSLTGQKGKDLDSDVPGDSTLSLADAYGNHDQLLTLKRGRMRVHSPVWLSPGTIAFAQAGVIHHAGNTVLLGVFQYQTDSGAIQQIASGIGAQFLSKPPHKHALAIAGQKDLYVMDSLSDPSSVRRIFGLEANKGFLLSVAWAPDDRIYFTVEDSIQLDDRHYLSKSRIASIKADGTDLKPEWAADTQYSYRYPVIFQGAEIAFCRFALDGTQQTLWSRNILTGKTKPVLEPGLRAVHKGSGRMYYIYEQDLRLRNLKSGADWVIVNSVNEAGYLRE